MGSEVKVTPSYTKVVRVSGGGATAGLASCVLSPGGSLGGCDRCMTIHLVIAWACLLSCSWHAMVTKGQAFQLGGTIPDRSMLTIARVLACRGRGKSSPDIV